MKRLLVLILILLMIPFVSAKLTNDQIKTGDFYPIMDGGDLYVLAPNVTTEDSQVQVAALFYIDVLKDINASLYDGETMLKPDLSVGDEGNLSYVLTVWNVTVDENKSLILDFSLKNTDIDPIKIFIEAKPRVVISSEVTSEEIETTNDDVSLVPELKKELTKFGLDLTQEEFNDMLALAKEKVNLVKSVKTENLVLEGDISKQIVTTKIEIDNYQGLDVYIIELIDKSMAKSASMINFNIKPIILENDPLIMWHLEEGSTDDLVYKIKRETGDVVTGNTIVLAKTTAEMKPSRSKFVKVLIPLALIPIIAAIIIYFGTINIRAAKKK